VSAGLKWVVLWPAAAFTVDGEDVVVRKGEVVPKGVEPDVIDALKVVGAVAPAVDEAGNPLADASRKRGS